MALHAASQWHRADTHALPHTFPPPGSIKLSVVSSSTGSVVAEEEEFAGVAAPSSTALDGGPADVRLAGAVLGAFRKKDRTTGYRWAAESTGAGHILFESQSAESKSCMDDRATQRILLWCLSVESLCQGAL